MSRSFDNQEQDRIRLEREALGLFLRRVEIGEWSLLTSEALEMEIERIQNLQRREALEELLALASDRVVLTAVVWNDARNLAAKGIQGFDALHLACARAGNADLFLTVDERLYMRASRSPVWPKPRVELPLHWLELPG